MKIDFAGLFPAVVLPMTADARIDEPGLRNYARHLAGTGIKGVAVNADTGEGPHLTQDERVRVVEIWADEVGDRLPIIAGLGAAFTEQAVRYAAEFKAAGASALLVFPISAYQGQPLDSEVPYRYHAAIADAVDTPLVLFNLLPALGGVLLSAEILHRLCGIPSVVAIKDASFDARTFVDVRAAVKDARQDIAMLTGDDPFIYESFVLGADGALLGFGAFPARQLAEMIRLALAGEFEAAKQVMDRLTPLEEVIFAPPVRDYRARCKEALVLQGVIERATVREPLLAIGDAERETIRQALIASGELPVPVRG